MWDECLKIPAENLIVKNEQARRKTYGKLLTAPKYGNISKISCQVGNCG